MIFHNLLKSSLAVFTMCSFIFFISCNGNSETKTNTDTTLTATNTGTNSGSASDLKPAQPKPDWGNLMLFFARWKLTVNKTP